MFIQSEIEIKPHCIFLYKFKYKYSLTWNCQGITEEHPGTRGEPSRAELAAGLAEGRRTEARGAPRHRLRAPRPRLWADVRVGLGEAHWGDGDEIGAYYRPPRG